MDLVRGVGRRGRRWLVAACLGALGGCTHARPPPVELVLPAADDGAPYSLAARRGEVTLLWFFATWCVPCQAMEPAVAELARTPPDGTRVIAIAVDRDGRRTVSPWVWALQPPYEVLVGDPSFTTASGPFGQIPELPATLFLDAEGRPVTSLSGVASGAVLRAELERLRR